MTPAAIGSERRSLSFTGTVDRVLTWLIAALVSWLCMSTMTLREQMAVSIEQNGTMRNQQMKDSGRIEALELAQAQHGWRTAK